MLRSLRCSYTDLHGDMLLPQNTATKLRTYLTTCEKDLDPKAIALYTDGFINYVRTSSVHSPVDFFVRAECRAEMKLKVTYLIDVCIDKDGVVKECQCECGAGMGPHAHCKHVAAVLYGLVKFSESGDFVTAQSCTQQLQTFHHTKKHTGSPVKAKNLPLHTCNSVDFDPRPPQFINQTGYKDYFRNTCINSHLLSNAPISQCFTPANPYGVLYDHCYHATGDPVDAYLRELKLSAITKQDVEDIKETTIGQADNDVWARERQKRITSSVFGRICKRTPKTDSATLARSLLCQKKDIHSRAIAHGRAYESVAATKYDERQRQSTRQCGLFVCQQYPYLAASPDRVVDDKVIVEIKCPYSAKDEIITAKTVPYLCHHEGKLTLSKSHDYYYQVQGQLLCTGAECVDFAVFTFKELYICRIFRDEAFIADMLTKLNDFFVSYYRPALLEKFLAKDYFIDMICHCRNIVQQPKSCHQGWGSNSTNLD